jgi:hypothetical protein
MKKDKKLAYYLTLFKIEEHTTWRTHLSQHKAGFEPEFSAPGHPKVTESKVIRIDRVTGETSTI